MSASGYDLCQHCIEECKEADTEECQYFKGKSSYYADSIKDSGNRTNFSTGAVRDMHVGKGRLDLMPACAVLRLARHFESGALKYGENNWQKGIPLHSYIDSAMRHLLKYQHGCDDEDHLVAATWNLVCAMWTEEVMPGMNDMTSRDGKQSFNYFSE